MKAIRHQKVIFETLETNRQNRTAEETRSLKDALWKMEAARPSTTACPDCGSEECWIGSKQLDAFNWSVTYPEYSLPLRPFPARTRPGSGLSLLRAIVSAFSF